MGLIFKRREENSMQPMIPTPDVLPLPAPPAVFLVLLITVFTVHVIFMNLLFGGTLLGAVSYFAGRKNPYHRILSQKLFKFMPAVIAITVNFGVAPLLFVQILYGHLFYSTSILIASAWFSVIPLVILGYYGTYILRFKWERIEMVRGSLILSTALIFTVIPFIFVNNLSLLEKPAGWLAHYFRDPASGSLNWGDPSMYPRYVHVLLSAVAVAGMWVAIIGIRGKSGGADWSQWAVKYGKKIFIHSTFANILIGIWFLVSHPQPIIMRFIGTHPLSTGYFTASILLIAVVIAIMYRIKGSESGMKPVYAAASLLVATIGLMLLMRQELRAAYLEPYFQLGELQVEPQWALFIIFAAVFLFVLIPSLYWMARTVLGMKAAD